jgi:hypothetical protein
VERIEITERSRGGVVREMVITGSESTIKVKGYTNIVGLITPEETAIVTAAGTRQEGWDMLPSPTYYIENTDKGFIIHGGGFGHGCGLSQYGADILAKAGHDYRYILLHYYKDVKFDNIYSQMLESDKKPASATDAEVADGNKTETDAETSDGKKIETDAETSDSENAEKDVEE